MSRFTIGEHVFAARVIILALAVACTPGDSSGTSDSSSDSSSTASSTGDGSTTGAVSCTPCITADDCAPAFVCNIGTKAIGQCAASCNPLAPEPICSCVPLTPVPMAGYGYCDTCKG